MTGQTIGRAVRRLSAGVVARIGSLSLWGTNHQSGDAGNPPGPLQTLTQSLVSERDETNLASSTPTGRFLRLFLICLATFVGLVVLLTM